MERVLVICIPYLVVDVGVASLTVVILDPRICLGESHGYIVRNDFRAATISVSFPPGCVSVGKIQIGTF